MAAYSALVSLLNTMDQIQNHSRISLSFDQKQIESLRRKVVFLLDFTESNINHGGSQLEAEVLESQITSAAYAAEDVIESHIVDQIRAEKNNLWQRFTKCRSSPAAEDGSISVLDLQEIAKGIDSIKEEATEVKERRGYIDLQHSSCSMPATSSRLLITTVTNKMIGLKDLIQYTDGLTTRNQVSRQIISATYVAEDVIESHIVDQIQTAESSGLVKKIKNTLWHLFMNCISCHRADVIESYIVDEIKTAGSISVLDLQEIIQEMDSTKEKVMEFNEEILSIDLQHTTYSTPVAISSKLLITTENNTMIGFDEELIQLMDELTGHKSSRQIISIVGMGGIGKTTIAKNVYENLLIVQHFDIRAWVTISQEYNAREIFYNFFPAFVNQLVI